MINELRYARTRVDGLNVNYLTGGQGDPLLVVHGGTGGSHNWQANMEKLVENTRSMCPTCRVSARQNPCPVITTCPRPQLF